MRHSTAQLAIALCTTMAVSSSPVSPNPISPAIVTPVMNTEKEARDLSTNDFSAPVPRKRSVGGFAYHAAENNEIEKRADGESNQMNEKRTMDTFDSDSDSESSSDSDSDSDYDVSAASKKNLRQRSIPTIWTRSEPASPQNFEANAADLDDNFSLASAEDFMSAASDDDIASVASLDSFSSPDDKAFAASDSGDAKERKNSVDSKKMATDVPAKQEQVGKVQARSDDVGGLSERDGGRSYMNADSWTA